MSSLSDLDRCEHGRHSIDHCLGCPDGYSTGNLFLTNGQRIGTDHGGEPIYAVTSRPPRAGERRPEPAEVEINWAARSGG